MKSIRFGAMCLVLLVLCMFLVGCGQKRVHKSLDAAFQAISDKDHEAAAKHVERAVAARPNDPYLRYRIVQLYSRPGLHDQQVQAAKDLQTILKTDAEWPKSEAHDKFESLLCVAMLMDSGDEPELARWFYEHIVQKNPQDPVAANNLAYYYAEQDIELAKAEQLALFALEKQPKSSFVTDTVGWVYFKQGKLEEAEKHISDSVRRAPDSAETRFHLASVLLAAGKKEQAKVELTKALAISSGYADAKKLLDSIDNPVAPK